MNEITNDKGLRDGIEFSESYVPWKMREEVLRIHGFKCYLCGVDMSTWREDGRRDDLTMDHVYPTIKGGKTIIENLRPCCKSCNTDKGSRFPAKLKPLALGRGLIE